MVYCHNLATNPQEFLTLVRTNGSYNYSFFPTGTWTTGTNVTTHFYKLRLDPQTLVVDITNRTFAATTGTNSRTAAQPFGVADDCSNLPAKGLANIDLTGTPFAVSDAFVLGGYLPWGTNVFSAYDQVVALEGGGACGGIYPAPLGDNRLKLKYLPAAPGLSNVMWIAAAGWHSLAVRSNGTVVAWGATNFFYPNVLARLTNAVAAAGGGEHSLVLKADGRVEVLGALNSYYLQRDLDVPASATNVMALACGYGHTLALKTNGTVVGWGDNDFDAHVVPTGLRATWWRSRRRLAQSGPQSGRHGGGVGSRPCHASATRADRGHGDCHRMGSRVGAEGRRHRGGLGSKRLSPVRSTGSIVLARGVCGGPRALSGAQGGRYSHRLGRQQLPRESHRGALGTSGTCYHCRSNPDQRGGDCGGRLPQSGAQGRRHGRRLGRQRLRPDHHSRQCDQRGGDCGGRLSQSGAQGRRHGRRLGRQRLRPDHHSRQCDQRGGDCGGRLPQSGAQGRRHGRRLGIQRLRPDQHVPPVRPTWWRLRRAAITVWRSRPTARSSAGETTTTARPTFPPVRPTWWRLRRATTTVWRSRPTARSSAGETTTTARPTCPASATNVVAIAAGGYHSLALKADGTVVGWGDNALRPDHHSRQCDQRGGDCGGRLPQSGAQGRRHGRRLGSATPYGPATATIPASCDQRGGDCGGLRHSLALKADGTVVGWGRATDAGQTTIPAGCDQRGGDCGGRLPQSGAEGRRHGRRLGIQRT